MRFIYYLLFICLIFKQSHSVEKYEKFIDKKELVKHFTIEEIENIKIPKEWKLIKDIKYYDEVIKDYYAKLGSPKIVRDLHMTNGDNLCFEHLKKFDSIKYKTSTEFFTEGTYLDWDSCIMYTKYRQFKGNPQKKIPDRNTDLLKNYLLYYSSTDSFILQQDSNHYSYYSTLSMLAQMYAIEKPYLGFTKNEIEMVEDWFIKRASVGFADSKHSFIRGNCKFPLEYDEKEINRTAKLNAKKIPLYEVKTKSKYRGVDECGSLGTRHAFTRLLIGLLANNQTLFDKGIIDLKYLLTFFDSNGVFMPYAARGGLAISYSANILNDISVFAEIFHSLGINFYEISIPAGIKIKDVMNFHYTIWDDVVPEELIRYAKLNFGNKTHDWTELLKPKHARKKGRLGVYLPGVKEAHIKMSIRYVQEYRKDIYKNFIEEEDYGQNFFGANRALNLHAILRANERYEANVIRVQKEKEIVALNKKRLKENAERLRKEKKLRKEEQIKKYKNSLSFEANEMLDDHVEQSELLKIPLPSDNRVIKDYKRFKDYRKNHLANNFHYTSYMWKEEIVKGQILTKDFCMKTIVEFKVPTTGEQKEELIFKRCLAAFMDNAVINFDDGIKLYKELLLKIATAKEDKWVYKDSGKDDFNPRDYNVWGVLSTLTMFYAVNFEELNYTKDENKAIQQYLKNKAMIERFDRDGNRSRTALCDITNPMNFWRTKHKGNNCGSVRLRTAPAEMALAIVMQDKELWAKGLWDLDYTLSMIEEEGFFVPLSAKGCKALGYTWDTSKLFSLNAEILKLADFNLLDYKTRHGKTVAEAYEMLFKQYEDITISNHIAKKGFGAVSCGTKPYKTHKEFFAYEYGVEVKEVDEIIKDNIENGRKARIWVPIAEDYINWSIRFVSEKHPEWIEDKRSLQEIKVHPWLSQYYYVQSFEIYNANIMSENSNIWSEKNKVANIEVKKEKTKCADSELNGEYEASWFFMNVNDTNPEPEYQGSEKLIIANCIGKFEGVKNFQPSGELRENLEVTLKSDGYLEIKGDLDLFEAGRSYYTFLEGNLTMGKISGYWEEGDLITIQLIGIEDLENIKSENKKRLKNKAKELKAKEAETLKEIPIFDFQDQIYSLNLSEFTFNEIKSYELATNKKFLHPWQLHKGLPYGKLINKEKNKTFKFRTLVFKQTGTMQRLVINIDDLADQEIEPFKSHRTSLQEKCGSELMDEWGWFSFIPETRDLEKAKQQQCHYDYFKKSNDVEAWELYQAVLGGAKSILKYIEENDPL